VKEKSTRELLDALSGARNLDRFMEENRACFDRRRLADFLQQYLQEKGLKRGEVIRSSQLNEVYAYQIFNGTKEPSRDKVVCLLLAMKTTVLEAQTLLKVCGYAPLYAKDERDCVLLYALEHGLTVTETNIQLESRGWKELIAIDR